MVCSQARESSKQVSYRAIINEHKAERIKKNKDKTDPASRTWVQRGAASLLSGRIQYFRTRALSILRGSDRWPTHLE